ncbi:MAG: hypothetical protein ACRDSH_16425 [Pseudonocardiaceae bacterium]
MAYDLADIVPLTVNTRDATGALADAGAVTVLVTHVGSSTVYSPAVTHPSVGQYQADFSPVLAGRYTVRWVATGANASGYSDAFDVYDAAPAYLISLADARETLRLTSTDQDERVRSMVAAATAVIERHLDEVVAPRTFVEDYTNVKPGPYLALRRTPVISVSSIVAVNALYTWQPSDFHVNADTGLLTTLPSAWSLWGDIQVTYLAGRAVVPENYQEACKIIVQHMWQTRRGAAGTAVPAGMADTMHLSGRLGWGYAIPNAAMELLGAPVSGFA